MGVWFNRKLRTIYEVNIYSITTILKKVFAIIYSTLEQCIQKIILSYKMKYIKSTYAWRACPAWYKRFTTSQQNDKKLKSIFNLKTLIHFELSKLLVLVAFWDRYKYQTSQLTNNMYRTEINQLYFENNDFILLVNVLIVS